MVHKFIRDHAWKFPSTPPLTVECGDKGVPDGSPELIPGVSWGIPVHQPRLKKIIHRQYLLLCSAGRC